MSKMPKQEKRWVRIKALTKEEKAAITVACERFIADVLKPRFLPGISATEFNYPVDIFGKWRGSKYSLITRYRSGFADNAGEEFNAPFCRLDYLDECLDATRFDVMWYRHTEQWWPLHSTVTLNEALQLIETEPLLQPVL